MTDEGGAQGAGLFGEALQHRSPAFALGERLATLHPDRHLIEGDGRLDVHSFARAGHCTVEVRADLHNQLDTFWTEEHGVYRWPATAWLVVRWQDTVFDVVVVEWQGGVREHRRHYVLAPDRERGDAFYAALCSCSPGAAFRRATSCTRV